MILPPPQAKALFLCSISSFTLKATCIADSWVLLIRRITVKQVDKAITYSLQTTISILTLAINVSSENSDPEHPKPKQASATQH